MLSLLSLIARLIEIYIWLVILSAVASWLIAFDIVNLRNRIVHRVAEILHRLTEPALRPIRRFLPPLGGLDLSPVVLILGLGLVRSLMREYLGV